MLKDADAAEIHMKISSPPIKYPDYYGIDTPSKDYWLHIFVHWYKKETWIKLLQFYRLMAYIRIFKRNRITAVYRSLFHWWLPKELVDKDAGNLSWSNYHCLMILKISNLIYRGSRNF